jgi:hypothetical protein
MKLLLIFISIVAVTANGFLGILTGALMGQEWKSFLMALTALLLSSLLSLISLRVTLKLTLIKLLPIFGFTATCFVCGLAYDRVLIPEGFKLIILTTLLLISGFLASTSINNNLMNTQS